MEKRQNQLCGSSQPCFSLPRSGSAAESYSEDAGGELGLVQLHRDKLLWLLVNAASKTVASFLYKGVCPEHALHLRRLGQVGTLCLGVRRLGLGILEPIVHSLGKVVSHCSWLNLVVVAGGSCGGCR